MNPVRRDLKSINFRFYLMYRGKVERFFQKNFLKNKFELVLKHLESRVRPWGVYMTKIAPFRY